MKNMLHVKWTANAEPCVLNLDENFKPLEGKGFKQLEHKEFQFYGGEPHLQITSDLEYVTHLVITQRYCHPIDMFNIILAADAAKRAGVDNIELILPYFPAARQDRVCNPGEPLTIGIFAKMINDCGFSKVHILSPHSEVTPALLNNCVVYDEIKYINTIINTITSLYNSKDINIVCPDAGAGKRVGKVVQAINPMYADIKFNLIRCEKERDVKDGSLKGFYVQADDLGGHPTLIIDDINSMGGTFIGLGKVLREKNCGKLMLFTSHADCAAGVLKVASQFDHYFTTNSKRDYVIDMEAYQDNLTVFKFTPYAL